MAFADKPRLESVLLIQDGVVKIENRSERELRGERYGKGGRSSVSAAASSFYVGVMANSWSTRVLTVAVMSVQLVVSVLLPISHATAEASALRHDVHIQAAGEEVCVPHADFTCQTCRTLGQQLSALGGRHLIEAAAASRAVQRCADRAAPARTHCYCPLGSRAPPVR